LGNAALDPDGLQQGVAPRAGTPREAVRAALGGEHAALAAEFAATHAPEQEAHVIPVSNGTNAITIALRALAKLAAHLGLRVPAFGDNVIVAGLTWRGSATAALGRYVPRLADVRRDTLCVDPASVDSLIDDRTVAIIAVHLYNRMADMDAICATAEQHGIAVIEDCAHAVGASYRGVAAGTTGHVGTFSMQGSKQLSAGEGGLVITLVRRLADQMASLTTCGRPVGESVELWAGNDRMPGVAAALARGQLLRFAEQQRLRQATYAALDGTALEVDGVTPLALQQEVGSPPTYKWAAWYDLEQFGGMSLDQLALALQGELGCEVARTYTPLDRSRGYDPQSDELLRISEEYWNGIEPRQYRLSNAAAAHAAVLCIEHAAGLDPRFPDQYALAVEKVRREAPRIARELAA
jgi:dTDP-4-amino-4,6-dideoxygalactose transaminase